MLNFKLKLKLNRNYDIMNVVKYPCHRSDSDLVKVVDYNMINSDFFNISMICPQKARFSSCLAIKNYMKANEITALPSLQARYRHNNHIKKVSDISNTGY